jgi:hypothetical protein
MLRYRLRFWLAAAELFHTAADYCIRKYNRIRFRSPVDIEE